LRETFRNLDRELNVLNKAVGGEGEKRTFRNIKFSVNFHKIK